MAELPPRRNARKPPTRSFDDGAFCLSWQYVRAKMYVPKCSTHMHGCGGHSISKLFIFTICWCRTLTATASMTPACASFQSARSQPLDDEGREAGRVVIAALRSLAAIVWTSVLPLFLPVLQPYPFGNLKFLLFNFHNKSFFCIPSRKRVVCCLCRVCVCVHALAAACPRESCCVCTTVCDVARVRRARARARIHTHTQA
jgi:hypothetical protein